jgi:hypothetical protein
MGCPQEKHTEGCPGLAIVVIPQAGQRTCTTGELPVLTVSAPRAGAGGAPAQATGEGCAEGVKRWGVVWSEGAGIAGGAGMGAAIDAGAGIGTDA